MSSQTTSLANKYRPHKLSDLIGQDVPVQILTNSFKQWSHAYLIQGTFGAGKTSLARIMAASQNCDLGPTMQPCCKCKNCIQIFQGKSLDVVQLDAASNRGIDQVRDIKKTAQMAPISCRTKYIILDECHQLTPAAAQSALKLIEQPPPNVRILLATTDPHELKKTIRSRCMPLNISNLDWLDLQKLLQKVCKMQAIQAQQDSLRLIARASMGSARMCLQNLQSVIAYAGKNRITQQHVQKVLSITSDQIYFKLFDAALSQNMGLVILIINDIIKTSKKIQIIIDQIHHHLRSLRTAAICKKDISNMVQFGYTRQQCQRYLQQSSVFLPVIVDKMEQRLIQLLKALDVNAKPQYFLQWYMQSGIIDIIKLGKNK